MSTENGNRLDKDREADWAGDLTGIPLTRSKALGKRLQCIDNVLKATQRRFLKRGNSTSIDRVHVCALGD